MSNVLKLSGALKVGSLASAPSNPQAGYIYFDTVAGKFMMYENGSFREVSAEAIEGHLDETGVKHESSGIGFSVVDGSRINIQPIATTNTVEEALVDLDNAIGDLTFVPTNYSNPGTNSVEAHLLAIDSALASAGGSEFEDDVFAIIDDGDNTKKLQFSVGGISTATTRVITMPDSNVNLGHLANLQTLSGVNAGATDLGTFTGTTIPDSSTIKSALQALETSLEALPDPMEYKGNWSAATNTPTLADGAGNNGDVYYVTAAGTVDFGSGNITFAIGDRVVYSGASSVWQKWDASDAVTSVNSQTGAVTLDSDDIGEGVTNLYFTDLRAKAAAVADSITDNVTDVAPSQNAVFDALALKLNLSGGSLTGDLLAGVGGLDIGEAVAPFENIYVNIIRNSSDEPIIDTANKFLNDSTGVKSIDWEARKLMVDGIDVAIWSFEGVDPQNPDFGGGEYVLINMGGSGRISGLLSPTANDQAATKGYVDTGLSGKANTSHTHVAADITDFDAEALDSAVQSGAITDGVTKAPTHDAVFDALAGKSNTGHTHVAADITDFSSAAKTATVADSITYGVTDVAPSQSAVLNALNLKLANVVEDTNPELGGDLDVGENAIGSSAGSLLLAGTNSVRRANWGSKSNFVEEEYLHAFTLAGSQTDAHFVSFAHATFAGIEVTYKIKQSTTNAVRIGTLRMVTNGTDVVLNDTFTDTTDLDISFSAVISGATVIIRYTSGTNGGTMRADIKKFLA